MKRTRKPKPSPARLFLAGVLLMIGGYTVVRLGKKRQELRQSCTDARSYLSRIDRPLKDSAKLLQEAVDKACPR